MLPDEEEEGEDEKVEKKEELSQCGANCHSGAVAAGGAKGTFSRHSHLIDNIVAWQSPLTT